jgi:hypothetical protein
VGTFWLWAVEHQRINSYDEVMRTTLDLDDAVLEAARAAARQTRRSVGAVISEWARRGISASPRRDRKTRIPTFATSKNSPPIDVATVKELLDDEGLPS